MIDKLYINNIDVQENLGFFLEWKIISNPEIKTVFQSISGADGAIDLTRANGRAFYEQREMSLNVIHASSEYQHDLDVIKSLHGDECKMSFASDPEWYYVGTLAIGEYETKTHKLAMSAIVYPFKLAKIETAYTIKSSRTINVVNDIMPVAPKVDVIGGTATLAWKTYTKNLSEGSYYIDELVLAKNETVAITVTLGTASAVKISYRKGRL